MPALGPSCESPVPSAGRVRCQAASAGGHALPSHLGLDMLPGRARTTGHVPRPPLLGLDMPHAGSKGWAWWHYVHSWTPGLDMPPPPLHGLDMLLGRARRTGHALRRPLLGLDMPRAGPEGWAWWHYVHSWARKLGMSLSSRVAELGMSIPGRENWACPQAQPANGELTMQYPRRGWLPRPELRCARPWTSRPASGSATGRCRRRRPRGRAIAAATPGWIPGSPSRSAGPRC